MSGRLLLGLVIALSGMSLGCPQEGIVLQPSDDEDTDNMPDIGVPDAPDPQPEPDPGPGPGPDPMPDVDPPEMGPLPAGRAVSDGRYATSHICSDCHSNAPGAQAMRGSQGEGVAPHDLWRSSVMGVAARDPFWRALVAAEILRTPAQADVIEESCMRCHAPMADLQAKDVGDLAPASLLNTDTDRGQLGLDGVSCVVCHKMVPDNLGTEDSFTGNFTIEEDPIIYGPYNDPVTGPMQQETGFVPGGGEHMKEAGVCGTCHALFTPTMRADGSLTGDIFPEQTTYLEWRNSSFRTGENAGPKARPCQHCHMPNTDVFGSPLETTIARQPDGQDFPQIGDRSPYRRHIFVGANATLLGMMAQNQAQLAPDVPVAAFQESRRLTIDHLQRETARLRIESALYRRDKLTVRVSIEHEAGHKFPTGFPSRRVWLKIRVLDAEGETLFLSGDYNDRGQILASSGQLLAIENVGRGYMPHYNTITASDQVQIYEAIMGDENGELTYSLLRAKNYIKDNRIVPEGYSPNGPFAEITLPAGVEGDPDFLNAIDSTTYQLDVPDTAQTVQVELLYQSMKPRFVNEMFELSSPEIDAFRKIYETADVRPIVMGTETVDIIR